VFGMEYQPTFEICDVLFAATVLNGLSSSTSVLQKNCGLTLNCAKDLLRRTSRENRPKNLRTANSLAQYLSRAWVRQIYL
jgi:hypothetical protein